MFSEQMRIIANNARRTKIIEMNSTNLKYVKDCILRAANDGFYQTEFNLPEFKYNHVREIVTEMLEKEGFKYTISYEENDKILLKISW